MGIWQQHRPAEPHGLAVNYIVWASIEHTHGARWCDGVWRGVRPQALSSGSASACGARCRASAGRLMVGACACRGGAALHHGHDCRPLGTDTTTPVLCELNERFQFLVRFRPSTIVDDDIIASTAIGDRMGHMHSLCALPTIDHPQQRLT